MPPAQRLSISPEDLEALIERGVSRALIRIGIAQSDDKEAVELQKDFSYLRDLRLGSQAIKNKGVLAIFGGVLTVLAILIYFGIQFFLQHPGAGVPVGPLVAPQAPAVSTR